MAAVLASVGPRTGAAEVRSVPGDASSLQAAVDLASSGDVIVVGPGIWNESVDLRGKAVVLRSRDGAEATILDGSGLDTSVIQCRSGETSATIIQGFTIRRGTGLEAISGARETVGGGLIVLGSSPIIRGCIFEDNRVSYNGGGAYLARRSSVLFDRCVFTNNSAEKGGGVFSVQSNSTFDGCTFVDNEGRYSGGGIYSADASRTIANDCRFERNRASYYGGAVYEYGSTSLINKCDFERNRATYKGGAVYNGYRGRSELVECTFRTNYDDVSGGEATKVTAVAPTGACVLTSGSCLTVSKQSCEDAAGTYQGDGVSCEAARAARVTSTTDLNNDGRIDDRDALMLLLLWR